MEFARSKSESRKEGLTGVQFSDVAGLGPILNELVEVVEVRRGSSHELLSSQSVVRHVLVSSQ
jgi:hypothetical protein